MLLTIGFISSWCLDCGCRCYLVARTTNTEILDCISCAVPEIWVLTCRGVNGPNWFGSIRIQ